MVIRLPGGSNSGGSSGGGGPTGAAGGSLTGTYPNPTIASIPSGATATTQAAADGTTKVATTAYVDTADALKANLASPTFSGTPSLPTGTTATTQSAADGSTKVATTAYTDTADALKANLASPSLTGTPLSTTAAVGTNTTQIATAAFVNTEINVGLALQIGPSTYATYDPRIVNTSVLMNASNDSRFMRVTMPKSGTLHDVSAFISTQSGNYKIGVYDAGNSNGTHTTSTQLAISGSVVTPASGWMTYDPSLSVTAGDTLNFHLSFDNGTASAVGFSTFSAAAMQLPTSFYPPSGSGTMTPKLAGLTTSFFASPPSTITDANHTTAGKSVLFVWRIT